MKMTRKQFFATLAVLPVAAKEVPTTVLYARDSPLAKMIKDSPAPETFQWYEEDYRPIRQRELSLREYVEDKRWYSPAKDIFVDPEGTAWVLCGRKPDRDVAVLREIGSAYVES